MKRRKKRKLTKAERKVIALRNLSKAHRGRKKGKGYKPRTLSRRRFKKKRVGLKRFGRSKGKKVKVLTTGERRRRSRRRKNPVVALAANPVKRRRRRRRNPWPGQPRRHAKAAKKGWTRRRRGKRKARSMSRYRSGAVHDRGSKRSRAAKKAARTRARNKAMRSAAARKAARSRKRKHGGSRKRKSSRRSSGHRKSPKRVAAAKKGARTRKRNKNRNKRAYKRAGGHRYTPASHQLAASPRRRKRRKSRRRNPVALLANPVRHHRRRSRRRNPLLNPLPNPMRDIRGFLSKAAGFGVGYLIQDGIDRFAATHVLAIDTAGNITDTPPTGTIYDSESPDLPIWSSWQRLAFNAAGLAIPGLMARLFWKEFWQRALIAATVRTVGKVAVDAVAHFAPPAIAGGLPLRLYGANYAAQAKIMQANVATLPSSPAGVFAGIPRMLGLVPARPIPRQRQLAAPQQQRLLGNGSDCGDGGSLSSLMTDPLANSPAASLLAPTAQNCGCAPFNPLTAGTGPSTDVLNVTPSPSGGGWGGGGGGEGTIPVSVLIPPPAQVTTTTPSSAPVPSSGSGSGGGKAPCDMGTIGSLQAALGLFNGSGGQPSQQAYQSVSDQLKNCGITAPPWTPPPNTGTVVR